MERQLWETLVADSLNPPPRGLQRGLPGHRSSQLCRTEHTEPPQACPEDTALLRAGAQPQRHKGTDGGTVPSHRTPDFPRSGQENNHDTHPSPSTVLPEGSEGPQTLLHEKLPGSLWAAGT